MPRHAPELECSIEDKASLAAITKSRTAEARVVERARIILACLEGKEIQQVARELRISVPSVTKWRSVSRCGGWEDSATSRDRASRSGMTRPFATGYWPCWRRHRHPACPIGADHGTR